MTDATDLIATCWTIAGNVVPGRAHNVSPFAVEKRIVAAAEAGYTGIGFWHGDLQQYLQRGNFRQLRKLLDECHFKYIELEYLGDWFATGERQRQSDVIRWDLFTASDALGARHIKVIPPFGERWPQQKLIDEFGQLCAEAATHELIIALEMIPFSSLNTLDAALAIVAGANANNGGLLLDIWHVARSGAAFDDILKIAPQYICAAELNDADLLVHGSLAEDSMHHRKLCGEGQLDIRGFISCIQQAGYTGPFGVEILSDELRKQSLVEAAQLSFATARNFTASQLE
jgi:sugar phosphate isomerase/epimerase